MNRNYSINKTMLICKHTNLQPTLSLKMEHILQRAKEIEYYINNHNYFSDGDLWVVVNHMPIAHKQTNGKQVKFPPTPSKRWGNYKYVFSVEMFFYDGLNSGSSGEFELPLDVANEEMMQCILYNINFYEINDHFPPCDVVLELFPYSNKYQSWHRPYFEQRQQDWIDPHCNTIKVCQIWGGHK